MKLRYLVASLLVTACASQGAREQQGEDKDVQQMPQTQQNIPQDSDALVPQDMGTLTQSEIQYHEDLLTLENEAIGSVRSPAVEPDSNTQPEAVSTPKSEELFNAETYSVQKGDTLSKIALNHYGQMDEWKKIAALNPSLLDPNKINVGQIIYLPKENSGSEEEAQLTPLADPNATRTPATAKYDDDDAAADEAATPAAPMAPIAVGQESAKTVSANTQSKNLSRIIGFIGFTLFLAVFVSFALSKPKKPEEKN